MCNPRWKPTDRELVFIRNMNEITPIDNPLFPFDNPSTRRPRDYLPQHKSPFGRKVADWQREFYCLPITPVYRTEPDIEPMRPGAPTIVSIFYTLPPKGMQRRPLDEYFERIETLAKMNHQTIIYVPPELSAKVKAYRSDKWWIVIDKFTTMWDFPNNTYQKENFLVTQPKIFSEFEGWNENSHWKPNGAYNNGYLSAIYNAKSFTMYEAVMSNPFGSERFAFFDAGLYDNQGPKDSSGIMWGALFQEQLSNEKFDRSISISKDSGIVISEYAQSNEYGSLNINHECFTDPKQAWKCLHFLAAAMIGSSLGMLNFAVRFMQTVDDMDANGWYTGREEMVISHVAVRYPNTIFSIPRVPSPLGMYCQHDYPVKWCYTTWGGPETVVEIVDPVETLFCKGYLSKRTALAAGGLMDRGRGKRRDPQALNPHDQPLKTELGPDAKIILRDRLSFGVELEFAVAGLAPGFEDPAPYDPRSVRGVLGTAPPTDEEEVNIEVLEYIASLLKKFGIPAEAREDDPASARNPNTHPWRAKDPESWIVTTDKSIEPDEDGNYFFHKIEITSPAFYYDNHSLSCVAQVCGVLTSNLRIQLNESMALHVHVGNGMKGFNPSTIRGVLATAFTFEPQIEKIHPDSFRGRYKWGPNLRDHSMLRASQERLPFSGRGFSEHQRYEREARYLSQALDKILECEDLREIARLTRYKRKEVEEVRMAYNIDCLVRPQSGTIGIPGSKRTIEFRQHEGTVDARRVTNWIRFCVGLVEFGDTCEPEILNKFVRRNIHDSLNIMNMKMICKAIGLQRSGCYYHKVVGEGESSVYWRNIQTERQYLDEEKWKEGWRCAQIGYKEDGEAMVVHGPL